MCSRRAFVILLCVAAAAGLSADAQTTKRDADLLKTKVAAIKQVAARPPGRAVRTMITEEELNSFLAYDAGSSLPPGVTSPTVAILGTGRVSASAVVDLDEVRAGRESHGMFDPMSYLSGEVPITAAGTIATSRGVGHFTLESAAVAGVPVPKTVLQQIVSYYSRTPDNPAGFTLDDPFELPVRIQEIQVLRGQAIIVQ
ncbi:MAG: hypothetical protein IT176_10225 [Acidobacteria bacterium]|nr:hypothetical protein [Acidobacteriota bacterium]